MAPSAIEDPQVVLITSDDPPIRQTVSRPRLVVFSKTFEDMLSIPTSSEMGSREPIELEVSETDVELKGFLMVLRGEDVDVEADGKLTELDWINLARTADKYNSPLALSTVREKIWSVTLSTGEGAGKGTAVGLTLLWFAQVSTRTTRATRASFLLSSSPQQSTPY
jgi:hypothetical protein